MEVKEVSQKVFVHAAKRCVAVDQGIGVLLFDLLLSTGAGAGADAACLCRDDAVAPMALSVSLSRLSLLQDLLNVATIASGSTVMGGIIAKAFEKARVW